MRFGDASPVRAVSFGNIPVEAMRPSSACNLDPTLAAVFRR